MYEIILQNSGAMVCLIVTGFLASMVLASMVFDSQLDFILLKFFFDGKGNKLSKTYEV